jgi:hypothetical protein
VGEEIGRRRKMGPPRSAQAIARVRKRAAVSVETVFEKLLGREPSEQGRTRL